MHDPDPVMNITLDNLARAVSERDLRTAFEAFGEVTMVRVVKDRVTGRSRGFGWVETPDDNAAQRAIEALDNQAMRGCCMHVKNAPP